MLDYRTQSSLVMTEAAYREQALPAMRLARSSRLARRVAKVLLVLLVLNVAVMLLAPWQQTVNGSGSVIAYAPLDRQQSIEAPAKGRVAKWGEGIHENAYVEKGQLILEIQDLDPNYLRTLEQQRDYAQGQVEAVSDQIEAERSNLRTAEAIIPIQEGMVSAYESAREADLSSVDSLIAMAEQKVIAARQKLTAAEAKAAQLETDYGRQKRLAEKGYTSQLKFQEVEAKHREAAANVGIAESALEGTQNELQGKKQERESKRRKWDAEIGAAKAKLQEVNLKIAESQSKIAKSFSELNKAKKELADAQVKLNRQQSQLVTAPRDGYVQNLTANEGQIVKEGDPLCVLVPAGGERAVQVWVDGNDAPLIEPGRHVRLQFEGWPAVQFSGWPSVAVGTFGGTVASVDATDDQRGRFRVLVLPDANDQEWPADRYLRQGVRANAWILLNQVTVGYELWRNLNGFPPVVRNNEEKQAKPNKPLVQIK